MGSYISCPKCGTKLSVSITEGKFFYFEPYNYDKKKDAYYAPRGMFIVKKEEYKQRIDFLLGSWADKIIIYDENKNIVETLWK